MAKKILKAKQRLVGEYGMVEAGELFETKTPGHFIDMDLAEETDEEDSSDVKKAIPEEDKLLPDKVADSEGNFKRPKKEKEDKDETKTKEDKTDTQTK